MPLCARHNPIHLAAIFAAGLLALALGGCEKQQAKPPSQILEKTAAAENSPPSEPSTKKTFAGSKTCYDCHTKFYEIWATSRHGLAMQHYSPAFAKKKLKPQAAAVVIGKQAFRAEIGEHEGWVLEKDGQKETRYPIAQVMGGKNAYYFLTSLAKGRLQVLPVAYDVQKQIWYDTAASGVRHFPDRRLHDEALPWTDRMFTFNTTCFDCHVSQLATNYDLQSDTYRTTWREAGISCESCHGPGSDHIAAMEAGATGHTSQAIRIIRTRDFTHAQMNDMCATCHAKMAPLSSSYVAGERFYDHYDLITLEHHDFYPDGRDLGENYTFTSWSMSPCLKSEKLDCNHCHTPSGRPRFEGREANRSCLPCHATIVENAAAHSHHKAEGPGNSCIACHMPMSRFAAMGRTDHSMRPPTPAATIAYKSPNACNGCHGDHDAAWSDQWVRKWYPRDYQAEPMRRAALLDAARKNDWKRLAEVLNDVENRRGDEIYRNSLVRLLRNCSDPRKWPVLVEALNDESPLVRASAAAALEGYFSGATVVEMVAALRDESPQIRAKAADALKSYFADDSVAAILAATADPVRLVRIRAAATLASMRPQWIPDIKARNSLRRATLEFKTAMEARPDDWASYSNLGGYYMESGDFEAAVDCYETALRLEPRVAGPMVNLSMAYANLHHNDKAEECLRRALKGEPDNAAAHFNLGLLLAEGGRTDEAEKALRAALKSDPQLAPAAYNLAVILGERKDYAGAIEWCRKAHDLQPEVAKYSESLTFFCKAQSAEKTPHNR